MLAVRRAAQVGQRGVRQISFFDEAKKKIKAIKEIKEAIYPDMDAFNAKMFHGKISYGQMWDNVHRNRKKPESTLSYEYKYDRYENHEKKSYIDTIHTGDLQPSDVAIALLTNAVKNNRVTGSLNQIGRYLYDHQYSLTLFKDVSSPNVESVFVSLIRKLSRIKDLDELREALYSGEHYGYNLALPAYNKTPDDPKSSLLKKEQLIAAEYDLLHSGPGLTNAAACIADLLAKKRIHDKLFPPHANITFNLSITFEQCLMTQDEYEQEMENERQLDMQRLTLSR